MIEGSHNHGEDWASAAIEMALLKEHAQKLKKAV
jgi:6,7-dimethyl-8-ribityllumazine synthase